MLLILLFSGLVAKAQIDRPIGMPNPPKKIDTNAVFVVVDKSAIFPGGNQKFDEYIQHQSKYPVATTNTQPSQKVVITFIVQKNGTLTDIKIVRSGGTKFDTEATRLITSSPRWLPGEMRNYKLKQQYTVLIPFLLN